MAITLFPHNQSAYDAAVSMMAETGKAAVIHPTGTGKSVIAFKLAEEHPEARVCWLSPSEYIFRTQIENLYPTGASRPKNIRFFTYARLMQMDGAELAEIQPDYIVLDEFHRCGAEQWGRGVDTLLNMYPSAKLLGLSATNIRYLDNQRDMAEELFDGNVASEMTLGDAIVRGILNAPTYVLSVFAYQQDYDRLKQRVHTAKSKAVRDEAERYLETLRRALENADGLDVIFDRHMTERRGKYLVFCANVEHMREMMSHVPEWFGKIDDAPRVYSVYADDPLSSRSFRAFKEDGSDHLKLLFCIDMLNEGVHVEDVSGVILFRPTVSPIIYKQQIGRALSASSSNDPIIFDVVNNIENLYSIDAVEEEMQTAMTYYRSLGLDGQIVNERFKVIDEVRDCMELFDRLNDTLGASWELMYAEAKKYREEFGDLNVPRRYVTADGYSLGCWLDIQRRVRAGKANGTLTEERIRRLDALGMRWESAGDASWNRYFEAAQKYYAAHGDLNVSCQHVTADGIPLGQWLANLRKCKKSSIRRAYLTEERCRALEHIGMQWDVLDYLFERNFAAAMEYHRVHGDLNVPASYVSGDGTRLGNWLTYLRKHRKDGSLRLTEDQIARLDALGMLWGGRYQTEWEAAYQEARSYWERFGNLDIPREYQTKSGFKLGRWLLRQREQQRDGKLPTERIQKLDAIGMVWEKDPWDEKYRLLERYRAENGNLIIPSDRKVYGVWLSRWLFTQKARLNGKGKPLTPEQERKLRTLGIAPSGKRGAHVNVRRFNTAAPDERASL